MPARRRPLERAGAGDMDRVVGANHDISQWVGGLTSDSRAPKVGIFVSAMSGPLRDGEMGWRDILAMVQRTEELGFDSFWLPDHLLFRFPGESAHAPWETWALLSALAATTSRIELGTAVSCTAFRSPALLAKMAETVDEISGGRLVLGLGAGWHDPEFAAFGLPVDRKVARFEDAVRIVATLLRSGAANGEFAYSSLDGCEVRPRGPRASGPPIMIGALAHGPRMLDIACRYADLWTGFLTMGRSEPAAVPSLLAAVDEACGRVGRDPATLGRAIGLLVDQRPERSSGNVGPSGAVPLSGSIEEIACALRTIGSLGVAHIQLSTVVPGVPGVEALAPVLPLLRA